MVDSSSTRHVIPGADSSVSRRKSHDGDVKSAPGYPKEGSEGLEYQATAGRGYQNKVVTGV